VNEEKELSYLMKIYEFKALDGYLDALQQSERPVDFTLPSIQSKTQSHINHDNDTLKQLDLESAKGVDLYEASVSSLQSLEKHTRVCYLKLMAVVDGLRSPSEIELHNTLISIGTSIESSVVITVINEEVGYRLAKVHCMIESHVNESDELKVTLYDNDTSWGTVVVSQHGIKRAHPKRVAGLLLHVCKVYGMNSTYE
jgi:hypothetical protein